MIKVCKEKAIERWTKFGFGLWYVSNLGVIVSIFTAIYGWNVGDNVIVILSFFYLLFVGMLTILFGTSGYDTIFHKIKQRQKLFAWNEDC